MDSFTFYDPHIVYQQDSYHLQMDQTNWNHLDSSSFYHHTPIETPSSFYHHTPVY